MISRIAVWMARPLLARILSERMVHYTKMALYWTALEQADLLPPLHEDSAFACSRMDAAIRSLAFYELELPPHSLPDYPRTRSEARALLHREQRESYMANSQIVAEWEAGVADPREEDPEDRLRVSESQRGLLEAEAVMTYLDHMQTDD